MEKDIMVNLGRVVLVNYGPLSGKLAVVVDLVNASKVVIEGPGFGVPRAVISNKRITLTKFSIPEITSTISTKQLGDKIKAFNVTEKFNKTAVGKRIQKQQRRLKLTDFERFKVYALKKKLGKAIRSQVSKSRVALKAGAKKEGEKKAAPAKK